MGAAIGSFTVMILKRVFFFYTKRNINNSCLRLQPRSALGSFGVVLMMSCKVYFHVEQSISFAEFMCLLK